MLRAACRLVGRTGCGPTTSTNSAKATRSWTSTSISTSLTRHPDVLFRDAPRFAVALIGLSTFTVTDFSASRADASSIHASSPSNQPSQPSFGNGSVPDSKSIASLACDIKNGPPNKRERALTLLSQVTLFIDHHDAVLQVSEVLPALLTVLAVYGKSGFSDSKTQEVTQEVSPEVLFLAIRCLADLAKAPDVRNALANDTTALAGVAALLSPNGYIARGLKHNHTRGALISIAAVSDATRLCAELASDGVAHIPLSQSGVVKALLETDEAERAGSVFKGFGSMSKWVQWRRVLGIDTETKETKNNNEFHVDLTRSGVDTEYMNGDEDLLKKIRNERQRHSASVWFGLAGSDTGRGGILAVEKEYSRRRSTVTDNLLRIIHNKDDKIKYRYAVGAVARLTAGDVGLHCLPLKSNTKLLKKYTHALASALYSGDGQAACFATGAGRAVLMSSVEGTNNLLTDKFINGVLFLLKSPGVGWASQGNQSGSNNGARLCALRFLETVCECDDNSINLTTSGLKKATAVNGATVLAELASGVLKSNETVKKKASAVLTKLGL